LYPEDLKINQIQEPLLEENTKNLNIPQETYVEKDYALIEARKRLNQLCIPLASPHIHNL